MEKQLSSSKIQSQEFSYQSIITKLCNNESGLLIHLLYNIFSNNTFLHSIDSKTLLQIITEIKPNDPFLKGIRFNLTIIILFCMADFPYSSSQDLNTKIFNHFSVLILNNNSQLLFKDKDVLMNRDKKEVIKLDFTILLNKIEFLFRFSDIFYSSEILKRIRNEYNDIKSAFCLYTISNPNSNVISSSSSSFLSGNTKQESIIDLDIINYYESVLFLLEKEYDALNTQINSIYSLSKLTSSSYSSLSFSFFLKQRLFVLLTQNEKTKKQSQEDFLKNTNSHLINLVSNLNSNDFSIKVILNLTDLYYIMKNFLGLNQILIDGLEYLKSIELFGNSASISNYSEIRIIFTLRFLFCCLLNEVSHENELLIMSIHYLDDVFMLINEHIKSSLPSNTQQQNIHTSNSNHSQTLTVNSKIKRISFTYNTYYSSENIILQKFYSNFQIFYMFYKKVYKTILNPSELSILSSLLLKNPDALGLLSKELLMNVYVLLPNDASLNRLINDKISSSITELSNLKGSNLEINILIIYNRLCNYNNSLINDQSNVKKAEYYSKIIECKEIIMSNLTLLNLTMKYYRKLYINLIQIFTNAHFFKKEYEEIEKLLYFNKEKEGMNDVLNSEKILKIKGDNYFFKGKYSQAIEVYNFLLSNSKSRVFNNKNQSFLVDQANVYYNLGVSHLFCEDIESSKSKIKECISIYESILDIKTKEKDALKEIKILYSML